MALNVKKVALAFTQNQHIIVCEIVLTLKGGWM
jgi:hypothetical protein